MRTCHGLPPKERIETAIEILKDAIDALDNPLHKNEPEYLVYLAYNGLAPLVPTPLRGGA